MSARQRHSRVTTSDGWTTISSSIKSRKNSSSKKTGKGNDGDRKQEENGVMSKEEYATGVLSALLAHKADLKLNDDTGTVKNEKFDEAEFIKVRTRVEKQVADFEASECCEKLKNMVRQEFCTTTVDKDDDGKIMGDSHNSAIQNVLILALGSLSESFKGAPGYQLAAILSIIEVLKESNSTHTQSASPKDPGDEKDGNTNLKILSYDPVYTPIDIRLLSDYNIATVPAASIPTATTNQDDWDKNWYENAVVYMPHAAIWLNHKYFMYKPKVWIGNGFEMYEDRAHEGSEVDGLLKEAEKVRVEEGYVKLEWPEVEWGDGAVFNNFVVYVRRAAVRQVER